LNEDENEEVENNLPTSVPFNWQLTSVALSSGCTDGHLPSNADWSSGCTDSHLPNDADERHCAYTLQLG